MRLSPIFMLVQAFLSVWVVFYPSCAVAQMPENIELPKILHRVWVGSPLDESQRNKLAQCHEFNKDWTTFLWIAPELMSESEFKDVISQIKAINEFLNQGVNPDSQKRFIQIHAVVSRTFSHEPIEGVQLHHEFLHEDLQRKFIELTSKLREAKHRKEAFPWSAVADVIRYQASGIYGGLYLDMTYVVDRLLNPIHMPLNQFIMIVDNFICSSNGLGETRAFYNNDRFASTSDNRKLLDFANIAQSRLLSMLSMENTTYEVLHFNFPFLKRRMDVYFYVVSPYLWTDFIHSLWGCKFEPKAKLSPEDLSTLHRTVGLKFLYTDKKQGHFNYINYERCKVHASLPDEVANLERNQSKPSSWKAYPIPTSGSDLSDHTARLFELRCLRDDDVCSNWSAVTDAIAKEVTEIYATIFLLELIPRETPNCEHAKLSFELLSSLVEDSFSPDNPSDLIICYRRILLMESVKSAFERTTEMLDAMVNSFLEFSVVNRIEASLANLILSYMQKMTPSNVISIALTRLNPHFNAHHADSLLWLNLFKDRYFGAINHAFGINLGPAVRGHLTFDQIRESSNFVIWLQNRWVHLWEQLPPEERREIFVDLNEQHQDPDSPLHKIADEAFEVSLPTTKAGIKLDLFRMMKFFPSSSQSGEE